MPAAKKPVSQFEGLKSLGTTSSPVAEVESPRKQGRPLKKNAKSRDTKTFRSWGGYLKIETVNEANYLLGKVRGGPDLSDVLEELLAGWVAKKKAEEAKEK